MSGWNNKIWCRTISWIWIAPCVTYIVCSFVIYIVVWIYNKTCCVKPISTGTIVDNKFKCWTCLVNAYISWSWFYGWIDTIEKIHYFGWRFRLGKFFPSYNSPTWSTDSLNTVKPIRTETMFVFSVRWYWPIMRQRVVLQIWQPINIFSWSS